MEGRGRRVDKCRMGEGRAPLLEAGIGRRRRNISSKACVEGSRRLGELGDLWR